MRNKLICIKFKLYNKYSIKNVLFATVVFILLLFSANNMLNAQSFRTQAKDKMIEDTYDSTNDVRRPNNINTRNQLIVANNFETLNGPIGENISNNLLSLELKALDVAYAVSDAKLFTLTIKNISYQRYTINLSDNYVHNIFFDVHDEMHLPISVPTSLMVERNNDYISYRSITLDPSEFLTVTIDLDDYVEIKDSGVYKVVARFYPEKYIDVSQRGFSKSKSQHYIESKSLLVSVMNVEELNRSIEIRTSAYTDIYNDVKLITREYSPFDVVQAALNALKNKNWDTFFSYVDIYDLFINSVTSTDTFKILSNDEKQIEITQFMKRMRNGTEASDLYPPELFTIEETQFTSFNAKVQVLVRIPQQYSILLYRYNLYLNKKEGIWKITDYNVKYLGIDSVDNVRSSIGDNNTDYVSPTEFY